MCSCKVAFQEFVGILMDDPHPVLFFDAQIHECPGQPPDPFGEFGIVHPGIPAHDRLFMGVQAQCFGKNFVESHGHGSYSWFRR